MLLRAGHESDGPPALAAAGGRACHVSPPAPAGTDPAAAPGRRHPARPGGLPTGLQVYHVIRIGNYN